MAKPQMVKCRYCGKEISKDEAYKEEGSNMYYCSLLCQNSAMQKRLNRERKNYKSIKGTDRRLVTDKIVEIYKNKGIDDARIPWDMIGSQMKNMLDEHRDWNYSTLFYVLWYVTEILEIDLLSEDNKANTPLSLIPYYVLDAKDYYMQTKQINELAEAFNIENETIVKATNQKRKRPIKKITF